MDVIILPPRVVCTGVRYRTRARAKDIAPARMTRERKICYAEIPIRAGVRYHALRGRKISYAGSSL